MNKIRIWKEKGVKAIFRLVFLQPIGNSCILVWLHNVETHICEMLWEVTLSHIQYSRLRTCMKYVPLDTKKTTNNQSIVLGSSRNRTLKMYRNSL